MPGVDSGEGAAITIAMPPCPEHPPEVSWPWSNLIMGVCPVCLSVLDNGEKATQVMRARRMMDALMHAA